MKRLRGPLEGVALSLYIVLVPLVTLRRWPTGGTHFGRVLIAGSLILVDVLWLITIVALLRSVTSLRRAGGATGSGVAWLAGLVVACITAVTPANHNATRITPGAVLRVDAKQTVGVEHISQLSLLLATQHRRQQRRPASGDGEIDEHIARCADVDEASLQTLHHFLASAPAGIAEIPDDFDTLPAIDAVDPVVLYSLRSDHGHTVVGFARPGSALPLPHPWTANQLRDTLVGAANYRVEFAETELEALRALAFGDQRTVVVYLGDATLLDQQLLDRCVSIAPTRNSTPTASCPPRVYLLGAAPHVLGIETPFAPTLRRRCIEMVAYLALHADPVTGDRLRSRVLVHADVDASKGTLANTATAVRRSLGADALGTRLHPVSAESLYALHGVTSDIEDFHRLIREGKRADDGGFTLYEQALRLVSAEPLSAVTRGFDWFVLEGHLARIQRDGEWAAMALYEYSCRIGDFERAFWALQQGLLLDPTNDLLRGELYQAPRLRQFGGDGAGTLEHNAVSPSGAVAMRWSLERFRR
jgi:hypothetical protein